MDDPFAVRTAKQRRTLIAALVVYGTLFVIELATGNKFAAGGADLLVAVLVLPASVIVLKRARRGEQDTVAIAAAAAFSLAGVAIGYEGLATLGVLTRIVEIELLGSLALLAAIALYLISKRR
jgi:hypothetical protein